MLKVAKVKVGEKLKESIIESVDLLGGLNKFINWGERVLLKPNFNTADPFPASSDLEFLKAVVEIVYECGAEKVMIGDASTLNLNTRKVMEKLGVFKLEKMKRPPEIHIFEEEEWVKKDIPLGRYLKSVYVPELLDKSDKLILLPCLKTHALAKFTGSLKLSVGFVKKPVQRARLHLGHLQEKIAELNKVIKPNLIIMDARKCFITKGPDKGEVREPGLILASTSRVNIDVEGIKTIQGFKGNSLDGVDPWRLSQIKRALELGIEW